MSIEYIFVLMFEGFGVPGAQRFDNNRGANGELANAVCRIFGLVTYKRDDVSCGYFKLLLCYEGILLFISQKRYHSSLLLERQPSNVRYSIFSHTRVYIGSKYNA